MRPAPIQRPRRIWRWLKVAAALCAVAVLFAVSLFGLAWTALGDAPDAKTVARMAASKQFEDGRFTNPLPTHQAEFSDIMARWFAGAPHTVPEKVLPISARSREDFEAPPASGLRITWLGHSSMLIEIDGRRVLTDPVFSKRCSPWTFYGPERFHPVPINPADLPRLDAVILSHDHYDHLDEETIRGLAEQVPLFVVPLGIGAHLKYWGVPDTKIVELDWWESARVLDLNLVATPARHFSGRGLWDANRTLWASWVIAGNTHKVYFSGDTAMFPGFEEIGRRLGPFDATMIEVGAYSAQWPDVHLGPEQAVEAHRMLRGQLLIPIHWGTFDLALHGWTEPVERLAVAAEGKDVKIAVPKAGESIDPTEPPLLVKWWPEIPWLSAADTPIRSTGLDGPHAALPRAAVEVAATQR